MMQKLRNGFVFLLAILLLPGSCTAQSADQVSGQRALDHVKALVRYGGRVPGSPAHDYAQRYIIRQLRLAFADEIEEVDFAAQTPRGVLPMKNIIAKFPGRSQGLLVVAGHYDSKAQKGFVGANDGGSSAGLLLELARVLGRRKLSIPVWVVLFDGEEAFGQWSATDSLYGSRYQASVWRRDGTLPRIRAFILLDMVGDKDLTLQRDLNSTAWLVDLVWQVAERLGHGVHFLSETTAVEDDHLPFARAGVPVVDLIDFEYGPGNRYWHTNQDTVDKLSARSLQVVGEVVVATIERLGQRWPGKTEP